MTSAMRVFVSSACPNHCVIDIRLHGCSGIFTLLLAGRDHPAIRAMYDRALEAGKYECVGLIDDPASHHRAYGLQCELEFFASLSVAFLGGVNDYYPFRREDLREFDPESYADLVHIWGIAGDDMSHYV